MGYKLSIKKRFSEFRELSSAEKLTVLKEFLINNSLYILLLAAIIGIHIFVYEETSNILICPLHIQYRLVLNSMYYT